MVPIQIIGARNLSDYLLVQWTNTDKGSLVSATIDLSHEQMNLFLPI